MLLLNIFTILKYGGKIFLAVMGFISFEDINQKPVHVDQSTPSIEKVNYVETLQGDQLMFSENLCYADFNYATKEKKQQESLFTKQSDYFIEPALLASDIQCESIFVDSENYFLLEGDDFKDFEILVFQESDNLDFEYNIRIIEENAGKIISKTIKNISFISLPQSID